jgi:phosphopantothenoylcysteine synthetase/decarboxylase
LRKRFLRLTVVEPIEKRLACGDIGKGAMADINDIVRATQKAQDDYTTEMFDRR